MLRKRTGPEEQTLTDANHNAQNERYGPNEVSTSTSTHDTVSTDDNTTNA